MAFHESLRQQFLQKAANIPIANVLEQITAPVSHYAVRMEPAHVLPGIAYWHLVGIHHLTPDENRGGHQIYVDVVDENGQRIPVGQAQVRWGWEGQQPNEVAPPRALDKPLGEPATNIDLYANQHVWVEIDGAGFPSDRVSNLGTDHADEPSPNGELWNSWGHHSFYVVFQRRASSQPAPNPIIGTPEPAPPPLVEPAEPRLEVITFGPVSHQDIINAFAQSAGQLGLAEPWALLTRAGMDVKRLAANRWAAYSGAPLHELPNLTVAEKNLLMRQLAHVLATMPVPPTSSPIDPPPVPAPVTPPAGEPTSTPPAPLRGNRLGFYLHLSTDQDGLWEAIRQVQPPVILVHADTLNRMLLREIRAFRAPNALVIGRLYKDNHTQRTMLTSNDPAGQGRAMASEILALDFGLATERGTNGRLLIDAWMSLNEAVPGPASRQFAEQPGETTAMLHAYDLFQVAFRKRLQEAGVEAVAFNFGAGNFTRPEHYLEHFPHTLASYTYLGFHEYGWPTLHPAADSATSAGLYRACMAEIRTRFGPHHRIIITEAGLARMYQDGSAGDVGWLNDVQPLSQDQYWHSLEWYNQHLLADDYAVGACLYEVGHHGDWTTFRHLGTDNAGQPLRLMERVTALNSGARGRRGQGRSHTPRPVVDFQPGQTVYSTDWINVRRTPGYLNKLGDDILGMVAPAAPVILQGTVVSQDGLLWWPIQVTLSDGHNVSGWAAEANATLRLLTTQKPRGRIRSAVATPIRPKGRGTARGSRSVGQTRYATGWINLRHTPGYVGKPSNDVQGEIPYGAKVEIVSGPVTADGLTWWAVRAPLRDNSVASGWAAEMAQDGTRLLGETPPAPPTSIIGNVHGTPLQPGTVLTLLGTTHLYTTAPTSAQPLAALQATLLPNLAMQVVSGPTMDATLEWWQIVHPTGNDQTAMGWTPLTSAEGTRVFAASEVAAKIHVRLPFAQQWPITQSWGERPEFYKQFVYDNVPLKGHNGIDFWMEMNTPLLAVDDGEVTRVDFEDGGFGHFVILRHSWGESLYAHLEQVNVQRGATLAEGQSLGLSGTSGSSSGPHLHFGIRIFPYRRTDGWGGFVNPLPFMQLAALPRSQARDVMPAPMAPELPGRLRP